MNSSRQVVWVIARSERPLGAAAVCLCRDSDALWLGLPDGGIVWAPLDNRPGFAARPTMPLGPVSRMVATADGVLFVAANRVFRASAEARSVTPALPGDLPPELAPTFRRTATAIELADGGSVSTVYRPDWPGGDGPAAVAGERVYWASRSFVFCEDRRRGERNAFVPWMGASGDIGALLAGERGGLFVATSASGVRRLDPKAPANAGYLRVRLGAESSSPADARRRAMAADIPGWVGTPYLWGGNDHAGVDCSGFVGAICRLAKIDLPRTSAAIARAGKAVSDELLWGDLLCTPGHVAIYIGDGRTAEAFNEHTPLGFGTVWSRSNVTVRRVL